MSFPLQFIRPRIFSPRRFPQLSLISRSISIQTAPTPNSSALKFLLGVPILPEASPTIEFLSSHPSHSSHLAQKLFTIDGVTSLLFGPNFITVNKSPLAEWSDIKPEVFALVTEALNSGEALVADVDTGGGEMTPDTAPQEGDSEVVEMVKELLNTRIRPSIQDDGGDIEYLGFDEETGVVRIRLRGACRSCESSATTMKSGIESMLMHYIEEVNGVEQVMDEIDKTTEEEEKRKFEEKLRKVKGLRNVGKPAGVKEPKVVAS